MKLGPINTVSILHVKDERACSQFIISPSKGEGLVAFGVYNVYQISILLRSYQLEKTPLQVRLGSLMLFNTLVLNASSS